MADARVLYSNNSKHVVDSLAKDFHTRDGIITAKDLQSGGNIRSSKNKEFSIMPATFSDLLDTLHRHAQVITRKDAGMILAMSCIGKSDTVVEAGCGSGMLTCILANAAKKVVSYDIDDRSIETTQKNLNKLGLKNATIKKGSIYEPIDERNAALVVLDVPSSWNAFATACEALAAGGFLVTYTPQATQAQQCVVEAGKHSLFHIKTIELIEREWVMSDRQCRPGFESLGHTGFLGFFRKV